LAYSYTWPGALPQRANEDYSESGGVLTLSSPMDAGPAKTRRRGNASSKLSVTYTMTTAEVAIFETFVKDTIMGTKRFGIPHPRTEAIVEARIPGNADGKQYSITYRGFDSWDVAFELEILP
jgi:hypothetical protein